MAHDGSVIIKIVGDDSNFSSTLKSLGSSAAGVMKVTAAGAVAATSAVAALGAAAINAYADYEQLVGGVETLFKESAGAVQEYAANAYKTAGMSANAYMETVTGFSASLLQSLGGDTEKAARVADMAITDMADNANKMGTSIEMIQNAYQGFAKQNYTMLDNLKLGYGGTKTEMERLLADAEKISGISYDISNLNDVYEAIHVIQTEMGITGTTAEEAAETIAGSTAAMKASWQNLMVGLGDSTQDFDALLTQFIESVGVVAANVLPRVEVVLSGIGKLIAGLIPQVVEAIPSITNEFLPQMVDLGLEIMNTLVTGITDNSGAIVEGLISVIGTLGEGMVELVPMMGDAAASLMVALADGLTDSLPDLVPVAVDTIGALVESLSANADTILSAGIDIIVALGEGLINALPNLIQTVPQIVINIADVINHNATKLLISAAKLIVQLGVGLIQNIPVLVANIPKIIEALVKAFFAFQWVSLGRSLITAVGNGVKAMTGSMRQAAADVSHALSGKIKELPAKLVQIGKDTIAGFVNGIRQAIPNAVKAAGEMSANVLSNVLSFFKIQSPSRVMKDKVGAMLVAGVAQGIRENKSEAVKAAEEMSRELLTAAEQYVEDKKFYNEMSLQEELEFWEEMKTLKEFSTEEQAKIDKKIYSAKQAILEEEKRLMEEHQAEIEAREKEIEASADRISGFAGLFDAVESKDVSGKDLIANLESQVDAIEKYRKNMEGLKDRGISQALFEELAELGPKAADQIAAMNEMTDAQLDKYVALFEEKKSISDEIANDFYDVGSYLMEGLEEGIEEGGSGVINAIAETLQDAVRAAKDELDIHSPSRVMASIGRYMAQGIGVGWSDQMKDVSDTIGDSLSGGVEARLTNAYHRMKNALTDGMDKLTGDVAVQAKGANSYTTNTTSTREGDFIVQIEKIVNEGEGTVTGMMEEFEFIRRQKAIAKGGA